MQRLEPGATSPVSARAGFDAHVARRGLAMRTLLGAIVGLLAGVGVWIAVAGVRRRAGPRATPAAASTGRGSELRGGRRSSVAVGGRRGR